MDNKSINIEFYQTPKLCSNTRHKIDFFNDKDIYNPFASCHKYAEVLSTLTDHIYDKIIKIVMQQDLKPDENSIDIIKKSINLSESLYPFLKDEMLKQKVEFRRSSKYFLQSSFAKMTLANCNSRIILFLELLGVAQKKQILLSSVVILKCSVLYIDA